MEQGFSANPEAFLQYIKQLRTNVGDDDELGFTGALEALGLPIQAALDVYNNRDRLNLSNVGEYLAQGGQKGLPVPDSTEFNFAKEVQMKANTVIIEGQKYYDQIVAKIRGDITPNRSDDVPAIMRQNYNTAYHFAGDSSLSRANASLDGFFDDNEYVKKNKVRDILFYATQSKDQDVFDIGRQSMAMLESINLGDRVRFNRDNSLNNVSDITQLYELLKALIRVNEEVKDAIKNTTLEAEL